MLIDRMRCKACDALIKEGGDYELCWNCYTIAMSCNKHLLLMETSGVDEKDEAETDDKTK